MNKQGLIDAYKNPLDKYGDKFLDFELELGKNRDNHFAINEMLDKLPAVYDYFSSLLLYAEEEFDRVQEELEAVEAQMRELIQDFLIREKNLSKSNKPTGEDIKARARILFGQYQYSDITNPAQEVMIKAHYDRVLSWMLESDREAQVDILWDLFVKYYNLRKQYRELSKSVSLLSNRTTALKMRKDTLLSSVGIIKDAGGKGLIVRGVGGGHGQEMYGNSDEDKELIIE